MQILDREQERIQKEQTPEGKRKKLIGVIGSGITVLALVAALYLLNKHPIFIGTPHLVEIEGITVEPGKTTVRELSDAGYTISDNELKQWTEVDGKNTYIYPETFDITEEAEERTYYMLTLIKDGFQAGEVTIVNKSSSPRPLADCQIFSIEVFSYSEGGDKASVDGVTMEQLSRETVEEAVGKPAKEVHESYYKWKKGKYSLYVKLKEEEGIKSFKSECEFDK